MDSVANFFWNETSRSELLHDIMGEESIYAKDPNKPKKTYSLGNDENSEFGKPVKGGSENSTSSNSGSSIQEMMANSLVENLLKIAIPPSTQMGSENLDKRMQASKDRPRLSGPLMTANFTQTNARLSVPFTLTNEFLKIFNWTNPAYTLSIMLFYSFTILKPLPTMTSLPLLYILGAVMTPQYLYIHAPETNPLLEFNPTPAPGLPLRKAHVPEPAPQLSQEFIINMTDLQNHMLLYVQVYDFIATILGSFAFFKDEVVSSFVYIILIFILILNCLFIDTVLKYIPFKLLLLLFGWGVIFICHPSNREMFFKMFNSEENRLKLLMLTNKFEEEMQEELRLVEAGERKVVAIFEIQRLSEDAEWVPLGFSSDTFTLFSNLRVKEHNIEDFCVPELDNIEPPIDWTWTSNNAWVLDLDPNKWVEEEFIQFIEIDTGTKWVYDVDLEGQRGKYRRRMWTNICVRKVYDSMAKDYELSRDIEIQNPLRQTSGHSDIHGVSRRSFTGNTIRKTRSSSTSTINSMHSLESNPDIQAINHRKNDEVIQIIEKQTSNVNTSRSIEALRENLE